MLASQAAVASSHVPSTHVVPRTHARGRGAASSYTACITPCQDRPRGHSDPAVAENAWFRRFGPGAGDGRAAAVGGAWRVGGGFSRRKLFLRDDKTLPHRTEPFWLPPSGSLTVLHARSRLLHRLACFFAARRALRSIPGGRACSHTAMHGVGSIRQTTPTIAH